MVDDRAVPKTTIKRVPLRLPAALHDRLRKAAAIDRRSMNDFMIIALERALDTFEAEQAARKK